MSTADAIRGYVVTLRREQGITIERAAKAAGLEKRAYILWEQGDSKDIKAPRLMAILDLVRGWIGHLAQLNEQDEQYGEQLALAWLDLPAAQRAEYQRLLSDDNGRARLVQAIARLSDDPKLRAQAQGYLDRLGEER